MGFPSGGSGGASAPGFEIGYDQITSSVNILSTTAATPTTIITCAAHVFDGSPVICEFYSDTVQLPLTGTTTGSVGIELVESSVVICQLAFVRPYTNASAPANVPFLAVMARFRFTPSAGSHSYVIGAYAGSTTGTPSIGAGNGTAGADVPAYVRFTKV